jgi:DNA-binding GntR family transcriptional regulator
MKNLSLVWLMRPRGCTDNDCSLAGNPALYQSWLVISGPIRMTMIASGPARARTNMAYGRHAPLLDLIEAGDAAEAALFLDDHRASGCAQTL